MVYSFEELMVRAISAGINIALNLGKVFWEGNMLHGASTDTIVRC